MRHAVIIDGVVVNIVLWDGECAWPAPEGALLVECDALPVQIGADYVEGEFVLPEAAP